MAEGRLNAARAAVTRWFPQLHRDKAGTQRLVQVHSQTPARQVLEHRVLPEREM